MAAFEPKTPAPDNSTDRGKIERIKTSGAGDSTEETEWVNLLLAQSSAPANPGLHWPWWDTAQKVLSIWDVAEGEWFGIGVPLPASIPFTFALSDETTTITTGTSKLTWRAPYACTLDAVRSSLTTASSSGLVTVDVNENGTTLLSTKLSIDASEKTSTTATTAAVISDSAIADDAEVTFDIDAAGTGATGLKVTLYLTKVS